MRKNFCGVVLLALCSFSLFSCGDDELENDNSKNEQVTNTVMEISNADELLAFAKRVDNGEYTLSAKLTADIDLTGRLWTPIAYGEDYNGRFTGDNHVIKGMKITEEHALEFSNSAPEDAQYIGSLGFFSSIGHNGIVETLILEDVSIETPHVYSVGAIAGESSGNVLKCQVKGSIEANGNVGGLVGMACNVIAAGKTYENAVSGSTNYANVKGRCQVGGVVGASNGYVMSSKNYGKVSATEFSAGGVIGVSGYTSKMFNLENYGEVSGTEQMGGIVGLLGGQLRNSINYASVNGNNAVGGVVGILGPSGSSWLSMGDEIHDVAYCVTYGAITGAEDCHAVIGKRDARFGVENIIVGKCFYDASSAKVSDSEAIEMDGQTMEVLNGWVSSATSLHSSVKYRTWTLNDQQQLSLAAKQ